MGIKSTTTLSRKRAEELAIEKILEKIKKVTVENIVKNMTDKEIEDYLEIGKEFDNYLIVED